MDTRRGSDAFTAVRTRLRRAPAAGSGQNFLEQEVVDARNLQDKFVWSGRAADPPA